MSLLGVQPLILESKLVFQFALLSEDGGMRTKDVHGLSAITSTAPSPQQNHPRRVHVSRSHCRT